MNLIDDRTFFLWVGIVMLVVLTSMTGMIIRKLITYRAHKRALDAMRQGRTSLDTAPPAPKVATSTAPVPDSSPL